MKCNLCNSHCELSGIDEVFSEEELKEIKRKADAIVKWFEDTDYMLAFRLLNNADPVSNELWARAYKQLSNSCEILLQLIDIT